MPPNSDLLLRGSMVFSMCNSASFGNLRITDSIGLTNCRIGDHNKTLECVLYDKQSSKDKEDVSTQIKDYIYQKVTSQWDFEVVAQSLRCAMVSGWYYEDCSSQEAKSILRGQPLGTFLMRNSSDPKYLFSLSVKTEKGPTSVRIRYSHGLFQMDCEEHLKGKLPKFDNVVGLINFHTSLSNNRMFGDCRWLEKSGKRDMPVILKKPKKNKISGLQHLCRLTINSSLRNVHLPEISTRKLPIPLPMQTYLEDYPYIL